MSSTTAAVAGQVLAESRMRFTCQIVTPSGTSGALDPVTGWPTNPVGTTVYSGKCRFRMSGAVAGNSARDVAGDRVQASQPTLSVPVSASMIPVGSVATITAVPADDPAAHLWLGLRMKVIGRVLGSDMTAQRLLVEVVTG